MVDPERLRRILKRVADDLEQLREYAALPADDVTRNREGLGNTKYLFVTAIEGCIDAAQHVCASERWGPPDDNTDAMRVLARHRVLSEDLAETMARVVGFRNVLVHAYRDVDDRVVVENLQRLEDIDRFVASLSELA